MSAKMPEIGLRLCGKPDGWVPGDDDDPRLEAAIERRADEMLGDDDDWCELFERAAASDECRQRVVALMSEPTCYLPQPTRRVVEKFKDAFADVAAEAAREELE